MTIPRQSVTHLPIASLVAHPKNVREHLGPLDDMVTSVREHGIIQPIVVTEHPTQEGRWLLLAGHRRTAAARRAGLIKVPAVIRHDVVSEADHLALMLVENTQRRELGPVEKAEAIGELMSHGLTQAQVARAIGVTAATVNYYASLLELDEQSLQEVRNGNVGMTLAVARVRRERMTSRAVSGEPVRGRPVQVEPPYFSHRHPLSKTVRTACAHSTRPKVGQVGCGQCWEAAIRSDALLPTPERRGDS